MKIVKFFCAVSVLFLILDTTEGKHVIEERSLFTQVTALSKITGDVSKGDYVAALIDMITMVEDLRDWTWLMRLMFQLVKRFLQLIHPVYLWLSRFLYSSRDNNVNKGLMGNMQTGIQVGASALQRALSLFGNNIK